MDATFVNNLIKNHFAEMIKGTCDICRKKTKYGINSLKFCKRCGTKMFNSVKKEILKNNPGLKELVVLPASQRTNVGDK